MDGQLSKTIDELTATVASSRDSVHSTYKSRPGRWNSVDFTHDRGSVYA
jgi:hypothetical protein